MIHLTKRTQKRIAKTAFVPVQSTFVTTEGPSVGTIWFDRDQPTRPPLVVTQIESREEGPRVRCDVFHFESCASFVQRVTERRYVLIGVKPPAMSHIETRP